MATKKAYGDFILDLMLYVKKMDLIRSAIRVELSWI